MTVCLGIRFDRRIALSPSERQAVESLIADCRASDGFDPCLHFATHLNADRELAAWRLAWAEAAADPVRDGAPPSPVRGVLAGAACAFAPGRQEGEISACVAPVFRRQGIFRRLYGSLAEDLVASGAASVLLVCEGGSPSSAAVAARLGATIDHAEYRMLVARERLAAINPPEGLRLVPVTAADVDEAADLSIAIFGDPPEDARAFILAALADPMREQYIARAAEGAVGMVGLSRGDHGFSIHGLGVVPSRRRRGRGGAILDAVLVVLSRRGAGSVSLDVDVDNAPAIALYRSRGFENDTRADYWRLDDPQGAHHRFPKPGRLE